MKLKESDYKNSLINCDIEDNELFPTFQQFVNNSKLYYCYLRYVYYNGGGGGGAYTSSDLNINNVNSTINFKNPALTSEQIAIYDDTRLNSWITLMNNTIGTIQSSLNSKLNDVSLVSANEDLLQISRNDITPNNPIFTFNVGQISYTDLSQLRVGEDVDSIVLDGTVPTLTSDVTIRFSNRLDLLFDTSAVMSLNGVVLVDSGGVPAADITTAYYTWVSSTKTLTFTPHTAVDSFIGTVPEGIGAYKLYRPPADIQDVTIESTTNTIISTKSEASGVINFDLQAVDQSKATHLESIDPRTVIGGTPFNLTIDTTNIKDTAIFFSSNDLNNTIGQYQDIPKTNIHELAEGTELRLGSLVFDNRGYIGRITSNAPELDFYQVTTMVKVVDPGVTSIKLGSDGAVITPSSGVATLPLINDGTITHGLVKTGSYSITASDGVLEVKNPLPTPGSGEEGYIPSVKTDFSYELIPNTGGGGGDAYVADMVEAETIAMEVFN